MATLKIFKNRIANSNYITAKGKQINFVNGVYMTDIESEITELTEECKSRNPHIYIDENEKEVDSNAATPMQILEQKVRAKILAEMALATLKDNNRGEYQQGKLQGIANSSTIQEGAAGSDSAVAAGSSPVTSDEVAQVPVAALTGLAALKAAKK